MRRTRLGLLAAPALTAADAEPPRVVAEAMAPELGWDGARIEQELSDWRELAGAEGIALR
jgi:glycerol-3-phosphate dehydrogenase